MKRGLSRDVIGFQFDYIGRYCIYAQLLLSYADDTALAGIVVSCTPASHDREIVRLCDFEEQMHTL